MGHNVADACRLSDIQWLAQRGYHLAADGTLRENEASQVATWLESYLAGRGGCMLARDVKRAAVAAGWHLTSLNRARPLARVTSTPVPGAAGVAAWTLSGYGTLNAEVLAAAVLSGTGTVNKPRPPRPPRAPYCCRYVR